MPAKSQQQMKFIYAMRHKYKNKKNAPKSMKWVFDKEWTSGIKMSKLPKKISNESYIMKYDIWKSINEHTFEDFTMNDMLYIKDLYDEGISDPETLSRESDLDINTVNQILYTLRQKGDIS